MIRRSFGRSGIRFLARACALAGTVVAVSVCGNQDKFGTGPTSDTQPPALQVSVPGAVADTLIEAADSLRLSLVSADNVRLKSVHLSVTGLGSFVLSVVFDTTFATTGTAITTYSQGFVVPLPATAAGQRMAINATATDAAGNVFAVDDTVHVNDTQAPVTTLVSPSTPTVRVGSGDTIHVLARATDPSGIRYLGARLYDTTALGKVVTLAADSLIYTSRVTTRLDSFKIVVPATVAGVHLLQVFAADSSPNLNQGVSAPLHAMVLDIQPPTDTILGPSLVDTAVSAGDSVFLRFRIRDNTGIAVDSIDGFALHGDSLLGTAFEVPRFALKVDHPPSPTDTTLRRYLQPVAGNLNSEPVFLRVVARDSAGNRALALRRIQIITGASVRLLAPANADTAPVGNPLAITVSAFDPDSVKVLGFVSTGAIAARDSVVLVSPLGQARSAALSLPVPSSAPLSTDTITPFFRDALGNRTVGSPVVVVFLDQVTPQVTFVSPTPDSGIAAGDSVRVRVRVQDNRTGSSVSLIGRTVRSSGLVQRFGNVSIPALNSTDTTVARYLPFVGDSTPEALYLVATVTDGVGHKSSDSVRVQLTGGPYVRITDPAPGSQIRLRQTGVTFLPMVSAFFPDTVTYLGVIVSGRYVTTDSVPAPRPMTTTFQAQQVALAIPANAPLGAITVTPFARTKLARYTGAGVSYELVDGSLPVVSILVPTHAGTFQIPAGDSLFVRVSAQDDRALASLTVAGFAHRPDVTPDSLGVANAVARFTPKTIDLTGTVHDTVVRYLVPVLTDSTAENVYVVATALDAAGNAAVDTVRVQVVTGPFVKVNAPTAGFSHPVGTTLNVTVQGYDPHNLTYVGYAVTGAVGQADSVAVSPAAASATQTLVWAVPASAAFGAETIVPFARNQAGLRFTGTAVVLSLADTIPPNDSIAVPTTGSPVLAGDSVLVTVRVRDNRGVSSIALSGRSHRGSMALGTDSAVSRYLAKSVALRGTGLTDTTVSRYLLPVLTDSTAESVYVVVSSVDASGNPRLDSVAVAVAPGRYVHLTQPSAGARVPVGTRLQLTVAGYDPDTLMYLGYEAKGRFPSRDSVQVVRAVTDAVRAQNTLDFWIPQTAPLGVDTLVPFARSRLGIIIGPPIVVQFVDNSLPLVDIIRPDSAGTDSIPVSDSLMIRVRTRDDQGVAFVSLLGRWNYPTFGDSTGWHRSLYAYVLDPSRALTLPDAVDPVEFSKFRINPTDADTTIVRFLHPTGVLADSVPHSVWIIAYAMDAAGNVGVDSVLLHVTTGPSVRLLAPAANSQVPMGAPLAVIIQTQNPLGIDSVGYSARGGAPGSAAVFKAGAPLTSTDTFALAIPASGVLDPDTIIPFTVRGGSRVTGQPVVVGIADVQRPTVIVDTPAVAALPVAVGDSVYVNVHVTDNRGVTRLVLTGTSQRGSVSLGTDTTVTRYLSKTVVIPPTRDTNITRYLRAVQADSTSEIVTLKATAFDSSGNAATGTATVRVVGGPKMSLIRPSPGALTSPGRKMVVEVHGVGQRGVHLLGWRAAGVVNAQDSAFRVPVNGSLADTASFIDTLTVPALTPLGTFAITAFGVDSLGDVSASSAGITVVVQSGASDTVPPLVSFAIGRRVEATDSIAILVRDPGGIRRIGWTAQLLGGGQIAADSTPDICCSLSDASMHGVLNLPGTLKFPAQVVLQAFASDSTGNGGVSAVDTLTVVAGKTYALPAGSQISDAIFNPHRNELYLSNTGLNRLEVFDLATASFVASIPVGSRPVGLALWPKDTLGLATSNADTVIVANSGGTNLSLVDVTANRREYKRYRLPNYVIQKVKSQRDPATQLIRVTVTEYDYADRPMYVAAVCRAIGAAPCGDVVAVYSTTPTAGQTGYPNRGYLAWENLTRATVDSVKGHFFWEPGTASLTLTTDTLQVIEVRDSVPGVPVRQILLGAGVGVTVDFDRLEFQDSTFVRSSGNYLRSLVGEGGTNQGFARVLSFDATAGTSVITGNLADSVCINGVFSCTGVTDDGISDALFVRDFIANRASPVSSIAINESGNTMLVRADSIYVFDRTLRQTGIIGAGKGAAGMDFHPANTFDAAVRGAGGAGYQDSRLLFAARPDSSIDVFDTYFYGEVTDTTALGATVPVPIRNALIGPVRVATYSGSTYLFGLTALGLVSVQLPNLANSLFPVSAQRPIVADPRPRVEVRAFKGTSPPRE